MCMSYVAITSLMLQCKLGLVAKSPFQYFIFYILVTWIRCSLKCALFQPTIFHTFSELDFPFASLKFSFGNMMYAIYGELEM